MDVLIQKLIKGGLKHCLALADDLLVFVEGGMAQLEKAIKLIKEFETERKQKSACK